MLLCPNEGVEWFIVMEGYCYLEALVISCLAQLKEGLSLLSESMVKAGLMNYTPLTSKKVSDIIELKMVVLIIMHTFLFLVMFSLDLWSPVNTSGSRPPPCSDFSFTMIDDHRAVLFGGMSGQSYCNHTFVLDLQTMVTVCIIA